ncbi:MAG: RICIN domain-containing protein [Microthrixaceae bacterium]
MNLVACDPSDPAQRIAVEPATPWAWSQLRNAPTNRCAEVTDNSSSNGAVVRDVTCESYAATGQGWRLDPGGLVISRIDAGDHGKCLDAGTGATGAAVILYDCHGQPNQRWRVSGTQLINDVAGLCLQSADTAGGQLRLGACNGSSSQNWGTRLQ